MTEEFKAARNPDNPSAFVLPTGILQQDFEIIDEQEAHIVLRVPIDLIRDNRALLTALLESVRRDHAGLHSFLSMSLIEARRRNASAFRLRFSQSLARRLHRPSHANVRSTTQRFGRTTNPFV